MVLAELELYQSRPIAPTRRLALGKSTLPCDPAPGPGGLLLAAVAAGFIGRVDADLHPEIERLTHRVQWGEQITQPNVRHRLQVDHVGLNRRTHRLTHEGDRMRLELDDGDGTSPAPQVLAAIYSAASLPIRQRDAVLVLIRRALSWTGEADERLLKMLAEGDLAWKVLGSQIIDTQAWAHSVLGLVMLANAAVDRASVQKAFREQLRCVHPDHGADELNSAGRIAELAEARRILLAS